MKKFIKNVIAFFIGFIFLLSIGILLPDNNPVQSNDYSIIDKHELLQKKESPRLILAGGSNVAFGFNSKRIADSLDMNVINTAIHAGYGLKYIIDDLKPFLKKGDIIILSPEYSHFYGEAFLGREPLLYSLSIKPQNLSYLSFPQFTNLLQYLPKYSIQKVKSFMSNLIKKRELNPQNFVYQRSSNNEFGDVVAHWGHEKIDFDPYPINGEYNEKAMEYIIEFNNFIKSLNGKLYISYPSLSKSSFNLNEPQIEKIKKEFHDSSLNIIDTPQSISFDDRFYYNTPYHLNKKGLELRTSMLIKEIKNIDPIPKK